MNKRKKGKYRESFHPLLIGKTNIFLLCFVERVGQRTEENKEEGVLQNGLGEVEYLKRDGQWARRNSLVSDGVRDT